MTSPSSPRRRGRRFFPWLALLLALFVVAAWSWSPLCLNRFRQSLALQDLKSAERWLDRAGWLGSGSAEFSFEQARFFRRVNRTEDFAAALQRAQTGGMAAARLQLEVDLARAASGDLGPLGKSFPELLQAGEDLPDICEAYVAGCLLNYQLVEAERILGLWQADFPADPQPRFLQGRLFEHRSDLVAAAKAFQAALELSPRHAAAACNLGRVLLAQQKPEEALRWYRQAAECLAEPQPALVGIARCLRELGQLEDARRTLDLAAARPEKLLIESYRLVGERSETALSQVPAEYGQLELAAEHFDRAAHWLEQAIAVNPYDWRARHSYATALRQLGRKEQADEQSRLSEESREALASCDLLIGTLQRNPTDVEARYRIGVVLLKHVSPNQGLVWLNSVLTYAPQHGPTHRALADYFAAHLDESPDYAELAQRHELAAQTAEPPADVAP